MAYTYALPQYTDALVRDHWKQCRHLGLILDKMVPREIINDEEKSGKRNTWLNEVATLFVLRNDNQKPSEEDKWFLELWKERYRRWLEMLEEMPGVKLFQTPLVWRMVVGLGGESVLETDLTLDHCLGLPIIPGSALKGLTRAWAVQEHFKSDSAEAGTDPQPVKDLFGAPEENAPDHAGKVVFFDAFPIPPDLASGKPRLVVDIMNPHYPKYYGDGAQGQTPPSNDQSPIPVFFLTVVGASFQFALAPRAGVSDVNVEQVEGWLQSALREYGAGGKTNAGYGAFGPAKEGHPSLPAPWASAPHQNDEVLKYTNNQPKLQGVVQERAEDGTIVVFKDKTITLPGFIPNARSGGRKLELGTDTPPGCEVIRLITRNGQQYIELDCPPKSKKK